MTSAEPDHDELLSAFLARSSVTCPRCGYDLHGLRGDRCPECGDRLQLQAVLVDPQMGAYVTTVVAASLGLGGAVLFGALAFTAASLDWWLEEPSAWFLVVLFVGTAVWLPIVLRRRRSLRRRTVRFQWTVAIVTAVAVATLGFGVIMTFAT